MRMARSVSGPDQCQQPGCGLSPVSKDVAIVGKSEKGTWALSVFFLTAVCMILYNYCKRKSYIKHFIARMEQKS